MIWTLFASDFSWAGSQKCQETSAILHYFAEPATTKCKPVAVLQLSSTLMTGQTRTNSHQLSSKFEPVGWELMRVDHELRMLTSHSNKACKFFFNRTFLKPVNIKFCWLRLSNGQLCTYACYYNVQTGNSFATLINSHQNLNQFNVDESWWEWMRVSTQTLNQLSTSFDQALRH